MVLLITTVEVVYSFGVLSLACEIGQRLTNAFDECSDMIDQLDWYLLTADVQRRLPLIMSFAQQPTIIECFRSTAAVRDTFKYVSIIDKFHTALNSWYINNNWITYSGGQNGIFILYDAS